MIDKSKKYWHGDCVDDIDEYLKEYSEVAAIDVKPVFCHTCGSNDLNLRIDYDEEVIQIICPKCGYEKIILDCEDAWEDATPRLIKCMECKGKDHNVKVGFVHRDNGSVKWVYIGSRCTNCGLLGSHLDWKVNYEPTDEMESNI